MGPSGQGHGVNGSMKGIWMQIKHAASLWLHHCKVQYVAELAFLRSLAYLSPNAHITIRRLQDADSQIQSSIGSSIFFKYTNHGKMALGQPKETTPCTLYAGRTAWLTLNILGIVLTTLVIRFFILRNKTQRHNRNKIISKRFGSRYWWLAVWLGQTYSIIHNKWKQLGGENPSLRSLSVGTKNAITTKSSSNYYSQWHPSSWILIKM